MSALAPLARVAEILSARGLDVPPVLQRGLASASRAPEAQHSRLAAAIAERLPALSSLASYDGPLCPAYPRARRAVAARLALGAAPVTVLRGLTPREAHAALSAGVDSPVDWVLREVPAPGVGHLSHGVGHLSVARWVAACWADPARRVALETHRTERVAGVEVLGRLLDRVDELVPGDLARGTTTGVQAAFEAAAKRLYAAWEARAERDGRALAQLPPWWRPVRCARALTTARELCQEGREMRHCVGTYASHVASGRSVVVAVAVRLGARVLRSTADVDRKTIEVRQHRGAANAAPPEVCARALEVCLRRWRGGAAPLALDPRSRARYVVEGDRGSRLREEREDQP